MAVSWVGGTITVSQLSGSTITAAAPSGLQDGDFLFAFLTTRTTPSAPSGWTRQDSTPSFTNGTATQYLACFKKNTVTTSDSSANFTFSTSGVSGITYAAARNAGSLQISHATVNNTVTLNVTPPSLTADADGELFLVAGSTIIQVTSSSPDVAVPSGFTEWSGNFFGPASNYRVAGGRKAFDSGQSNSGSFLMDAGASSNVNGLAAITVRLKNFSPSAISSDVGPLGQVFALAKYGTEINAISSTAGPLNSALALANVVPAAYSAATGPLGYAAGFAYQTVASALASGPLSTNQTARTRAVPVGFVSLAGPLSANQKALAFHDFTTIVGDVSHYVMDLIDVNEVSTRLPISSWQATQQVERSNYLQCVIPAATEWVDALNAAVSFVVYRRAILDDGFIVEYEMARSVVTEVRFDTGPTRSTCTLSGYEDGIADPGTTPTAYDRTLTGVRLVSTSGAGLRVRCSIDWLLRPGHRAYVDGAPFIVGYMNLYATGTDSYMDVGELAT
jgi:hypothetical protein